MTSPATNADPPANDPAAVLEFLYRLGQAYLGCSEQTAQVELLLRRIAAAYGMRRARVVAFPTAVFITLHDGREERITLAEGPTQVLRLDQVADVYALGSLAQQGGITAEDGLKQLSTILRKKTRFGSIGTVAGHVVLCVGLAIVLQPSRSSMIAAGILGLVVGLLKSLNRSRAVLAVPLPVVAAILVSTLVYVAADFGLKVNPAEALIPPLVTFLPGAMLTLGMVELAYGDMVSGSSRLTTGLIQLILLTFGLSVGAAIVGVGPERLVEVQPPDPGIAWEPWVGVVVFGIGVFLHFSAPKKSLPWLLLVLLIAFAAQKLATLAFGNKEVSGFFGMLIATPLGYLIQLKFRGPPAMVTFLPTFWLLVPGALGLMSVTRMLSDRAAGVDGLTSAMFAFVSIALGTLMGASLYKWLTEQFAMWQLQIGRVGSYFRRGRR